jgi:hypothetical protein
VHARRVQRLFARPLLIAFIAMIETMSPRESSARAQPVAGPPLSGDPVVARLQRHEVGALHPIVIVVDGHDFPLHVWRRVRNLIAFRLHRHLPDGTTAVDAPVYLIRSSAIYQKAAAALAHHTSSHEYVWCLLAAVLVHEAAHTAPMTERQALSAEAAQLRRCLFAGHLHTGDGWSAGAYLQQVEARLRKPREHY